MDKVCVKDGLAFLGSLKGWVGQKNFSLDRIKVVAEHLQNPQDKFKSIHVAGTNGKGSTASVMNSILLEAGFQVGLYTSPHLNSINERIKINYNDISDECLIANLHRVKEAMSASCIELSQFEVLTLISFLVFQAQRVGYAVIEVGLGGRLDATNIISMPDIALITSISEDHQDILGNSIAEIAREKAGIIKDGTTLILGDLPQEAKQSIDEYCYKCRQVYEFNKDFYGNSMATHFYESEQELEFSDPNNQIILKTSLLGKHQVSNISIAVKAALHLGISQEKIMLGVKKAVWKARLEILSVANRTILLDAAHNEAGVLSAVNFCKENHFVPDVIVFSSLKTKDWSKMLSKIDIKIKQWFIIEPDSEMAISTAEIEKFISMHDLGATKSFAKNYRQLANEIINLPQNTSVLALGSIYMLAALKPQLMKGFQQKLGCSIL